MTKAKPTREEVAAVRASMKYIWGHGDDFVQDSRLWALRNAVVDIERRFSELDAAKPSRKGKKR